MIGSFRRFAKLRLLTKFKKVGDIYSNIYRLRRRYMYFYLTKRKFKQYQFRRRFYKRVLVPHKRDTILRAFAFLKTWQVLAYKRTHARRKSRTRGLPRYYRTAREMWGMKFGEFIRTRRHGRFRSKVDKKKIDKLQRDVAKAKRMRRHWAKEHSRLLRKAQSETKSKGLKKLNIKTKSEAMKRK